jgi:hypothetical protein
LKFCEGRQPRPPVIKPRPESYGPELESLLLCYTISTGLPNRYQDSSVALNTRHNNGDSVRTIRVTGEGTGLGI